MILSPMTTTFFAVLGTGDLAYFTEEILNRVVLICADYVLEALNLNTPVPQAYSYFLRAKKVDKLIYI